MKRNFKIAGFLLLIAWLFFAILPVFAQRIEEVEKTQQEIERERFLREKIERKKPITEAEEAPIPEAAVTPLAEEKALVKTITVVGVTLIQNEAIKNVIKPYENQELTVRKMQEVADRITDAYRQRGFVTSRAYLPPQKITDGILEVRVIEGITGDIDTKGNRYFKSALYRKKITLKKGQPFNYDKLRKGLSIINQLPDRNAKAVLAPGKEAGATDVILEVKDRLPMHIGFDWDNYGSRYVDKDRLRTTLTHNNFLGLDDVLTLQYQVSEGENYKLLLLRYLFQVTESLKLGFFAADSDIDLRQEFEDENQDAYGNSNFYSLYLTQSLVNKENINLNLNAGFDYKDTFNYQNGLMSSRDRMRVLKGALELDLTDPLGRTIINNEVSFGIKNIWGGSEEADPHSSRAGAGGEFFKDNLDILRLQRMPFNSTLLWKNRFQFTPDILTSAEQFQVGGIINVRGYPAAEAVGDQGYSMTWELSVPPYFLPKDIKVPFSQAKFYDALRFITFYDWADAQLESPAATEDDSKTLRAVGCGLRFNLPEDFSLRVEVGWPLDNTPSDNDHAHVWTEVSKSF